MEFIKQSTSVTKKMGPFVDDTDGKTAETALTINQADVRLSKNGGAFAQKNDSNAASHDENGYYGVQLDATDTGTLGSLRVAISVSGALPVWHDFMVLTANVYDTMFSTDKLDVNIASTDDIDFSATQKTSLNAATPDLSAITGDKDSYKADVAGHDTEMAHLDVDVSSRNAIAPDNANIVNIHNIVKSGGTGDCAAILADTNELQTDDIPTKIAAVQTEVDKIDALQTDLDTITDTGVNTVSISANAIDASALASDAVDEIWAKAMSDLAQGAPSATASVLTAINYLYEAWRNKTETTATRITTYKDDGTTELTRSTISDDGTTFTKGEMVTGA